MFSYHSLGGSMAWCYPVLRAVFGEGYRACLARKSNGARVLRDESVVVTINHGKVTAWGKPLWGDVEEGENVNDPGKVKALLQLQHGGHFIFRRTPPLKVVGRAAPWHMLKISEPWLSKSYQRNLNSQNTKMTLK